MNSNSDIETPPTGWALAGLYIVCYASWFLLCGLGLWLIFLLRTNLVDDILFMRVNTGVLRAIDRWGLWLMGAGWIFGIFLVEGHLRQALERGRLWSTIGRFLGIELGLIGLSFVIHYF